VKGARVPTTPVPKESQLPANISGAGLLETDEEAQLTSFTTCFTATIETAVVSTAAAGIYMYIFTYICVYIHVYIYVSIWRPQ